jgi:hypothetical protein
MSNPTKKGTKSEAAVASEAKRKKDILDKVEQSNLPTKTILKELGISRSTYYSWLKRYEEEGMDGLLDSRSLAKKPEVEKKPEPAVEEAEPQPVAEEPAVVVEADKPAEPVADLPGAEEPVAEIVEKVVVETDEPVAATAAGEARTEDTAVMTEEKTTFGGGGEKKGMGAYSLIAIFLLIIGLLFSISSSNYNTYELRKNGDKITLWKGKFAPMGSEEVQSLDTLEAGDGDYGSLLNKTYSGKDSVYNALFGFFMDRVDREVRKGSDADMTRINRLMDKAESIIGGDLKRAAGLSGIQFQLAQKRVAIAEMGLQQVYEKALPVYQEALKTGQGNAAELEAKIAAMQEALGQGVEQEIEVVVEESAAEETEPAVAEAPAAEEASPEPPPDQPEGESEGETTQ